MDDQNQNQPQEEEKIEEAAEQPEPVEPVAEAATEAAAQEVEETEQSTEEASAEETPDEKPAEEAKTEEGPEIIEDVKEATEEMEPSATASNVPSSARWFIVHTYSGHENKVAKSLKQRVQSLGFEDRIFDIIVPTRNTIKVSQGKKEKVKEKIFPGYVLVRMILDDESWLTVRTTQGVTAFIGAGNKPTPISEDEVAAIMKFMNTEEPLYKAAFTVGEAVKIVDGPFADFLGTIDSIDEAKGKLKVLVSIFGRETPVELDFLQVNKL